MALIVDDDNKDNFTQLAAMVEEAMKLGESQELRVAFDCEGVNLSRVGTVEVVALCFEQSMNSENSVFLVDTSPKSSKEKLVERVQLLKQLFECSHVTKVIHDCRMDSDALYHHHGIVLRSVHDTSCFHALETGIENANLNDMLNWNGIAQNSLRDKSVYKRNPRFWATRPLTPTMIEWSTSDVDKLLRVAESQKVRSEEQGYFTEAKTKSDDFSADVKDMQVETGVKCKVPIGSFIGRRGVNIRRLEKRTGALMYDEHTGRGTWMIFYKDSASLAAVKRAMGHY